MMDRVNRVLRRSVNGCMSLKGRTHGFGFWEIRKRSANCDTRHGQNGFLDHGPVSDEKLTYRDKTEILMNDRVGLCRTYPG